MFTLSRRYLAPSEKRLPKAAQNRNVGLINQSKTPEKRAGIKKLDDDRIIPGEKSTIYEILMRGFTRAGFGTMKGIKYLYHPHGLRKSFRTIVGSVNPDLAELCLGHEGYLSISYIRLDIVKEYEKVEHLLSLTSNAGMNSRVKVLEREKEALEARLKALEQAQAHSLTALVEDAGREFKSEQVQVAFKAALKALKSINTQ